MNQTPSQGSDQTNEHLQVLRNYARKALVHGKRLTRLEQFDKTTRMKHFRAIGSSHQLTGSEMTRLIFKGLLCGTRRCGCPTCQARREYNPNNPETENEPRRPSDG